MVFTIGVSLAFHSVVRLRFQCATMHSKTCVAAVTMIIYLGIYDIISSPGKRILMVSKAAFLFLPRGLKGHFRINRIINICRERAAEDALCKAQRIYVVENDILFTCILMYIMLQYLMLKSFLFQPTYIVAFTHSHERPRYKLYRLNHLSPPHIKVLVVS